MAESAVSSAAQWIGKLLTDEARYLDKVSERVEVLQAELEWMQCFLQDADEKSQTRAVVRKWVCQVKDYAYEAEDIIETYLLKVSPHSRHKIVRLFSRKTILRYLCIWCRDPLTLHWIGSEIDALTDNISKLTQRLQTYGLVAKDNPWLSSVVDPITLGLLTTSSSFSDKKDSDIIGLDKDIRTLVDNLLINNNSKDGHKVIVGVCGMGGMGKTTLAREVYNHKDLKGRFDAFAWAYVSQKFDAKSILASILKTLIPERDQGMKDRYEKLIDGGEVQKGVHDIMQEINCLVVLDDVWTFKDLNRLRDAFPIYENTGSRIILTTRNSETIRGLDSLVFLHEPKGLSPEDAWELFVKKAFPTAETCPGLDDDAAWEVLVEKEFPSTQSCYANQMKNLAKGMLDHCKGVPLAIAVLGAVLRTKKMEREWKVVRNNVSLYLRKGAVPNQPYKNVYDVLSMSYDNLPSHLKPCFLYLAAFPEDFQIHTEKLFQLWIADGIVSAANIDGEDLREEDVAEVYLNELESKNMLQVVQRDPNNKGRIETCVLHDLMRDICVAKAKDENFLHVVNCGKHDQPMQAAPLNSILRHNNPSLVTKEKLRRLVVHVDKDLKSISSSSTTTTVEPADSSTSSSSSSSSLQVVLPNNPFLRSLLFFPIGENSMEEECSPFMEKIRKDFPLLRVLDFENLQIKGSLPENVDDMIHLRYLGLRHTSISQLPVSIGKLQLLQTLDLRTSLSQMISLPNVLWKMRLLKHLYLPYFGGISLASDGGRNVQKYNLIGGPGLRLDGLRYLETVENLNLETVSMTGLHNFANMKTFSASCISRKEALEHFLQEQSTMKKVYLRIHPRVLNEKPEVLSGCSSLDVLDIHSPMITSL